jgi:hypothetical protein
MNSPAKKAGDLTKNQKRILIALSTFAAILALLAMLAGWFAPEIDPRFVGRWTIVELYQRNLSQPRAPLSRR